MNKPAIKLEPTKDCCPQWPLFKEGFGWMEFKESYYGVMPYLEICGTRWRIFHCPSCGADVTNVVVLINR